MLVKPNRKLESDEVKCLCIFQYVSKAFDFQFSIDMLPVLLHSSTTNEQGLCDFRVVMALGQ